MSSFKKDNMRFYSSTKFNSQHVQSLLETTNITACISSLLPELRLFSKWSYSLLKLLVSKLSSDGLLSLLQQHPLLDVLFQVSVVSSLLINKGIAHSEPGIRREVVTVLATMSNLIGPSFATNYLHTLKVAERKLIDMFSARQREQVSH